MDKKNFNCEDFLNWCKANVKAEWVWITPEMATEWLKKNIRNRKGTKPTTNSYKRQMEDGEWKINGETIIFGESGVLLDGQNRLMACEKSKTPFGCLIVYGMPDDVFETIDTGKSRSLKDIMGADNIKDYDFAASIVKKYLNMVQGHLCSHGSYQTRSVANPSECIACYESFKDEFISIITKAKSWTVKGLFSGKEIGGIASYMILKKKYPKDIVYEFFDCATNSDRCREYPQTHTLHKKIQDEANCGNNPTTAERLNYIFDAFNKFIKNENCLKLHRRTDVSELQVYSEKKTKVVLKPVYT